MSKEKQIEELINELVFTSNYGTLGAVAKHLYEKGYRKQHISEGDPSNELIEIVKPYVSGCACEVESGSCELTDCRSCNALNLAKEIYEAGYRKQSENTVVLPYKVGQVVYVLKSKTSNGKNLYLREERISHYRIFGDWSYMCFESERLSVPDYLWKTTVFLTQEEAEAKMKGGAE